MFVLFTSEYQFVSYRFGDEIGDKGSKDALFSKWLVLGLQGFFPLWPIYTLLGLVKCHKIYIKVGEI